VSLLDDSRLINYVPWYQYNNVDERGARDEKDDNEEGESYS
jgi:hypothetical protein